jgi:O-antigen/teichoic acid export membrane protein
LTVFGLEQIGMRRFVWEPDRRDLILGATLAIRSAGALIAAVGSIAIVLAFGGPEGTAPLLVLLASLSLLFLPADAIATFLRAEQRMRGIAISQTVAALVVAGLAIALVALRAPLEGFVALPAVASATAAVGFVVAYRAVVGSVPKPRLEWSLVCELLRDGWPLLLSAFAVVLYMRIDQVMLGHMATPAELGHYATAVRFAEMFYFAPMAISAAFYADLARAHSASAEVFSTAIQRFYDVMVMVSFALLGASLIGGAVVFVPLFGQDYAPALPMYYVLAVNIVFVSVGVARGAMLTIRGWLWTSSVTTAIGAVINILLNLLLIPRYGALGAAWATLFSYWVAAHGMTFVLPWLRPTGHMLNRSLNPVGACARLLARSAEVRTAEKS